MGEAVFAGEPGEQLGDRDEPLGLGAEGERRPVTLAVHIEVLLVVEEQFDGDGFGRVDSSVGGECGEASEVTAAVADGRLGIVVDLHPAGVVADRVIECCHGKPSRWRPAGKPRRERTRRRRATRTNGRPPAAKHDATRARGTHQTPVNRYYDPATAGFLTVDPLVEATTSAYGYVDGEPLDHTDPLGLCKFGIFGKHCPKIVRRIADVVGGVGGLAAGVVGAVSVAVGAPELVVGLGAVASGLSIIDSAYDAYQDCIGDRKSHTKCIESLAFLGGNIASAGAVGIAGHLPEEVGQLIQMWGHITNFFDSGGELLRNLFGTGDSTKAPCVAGHGGLRRS